MRLIPRSLTVRFAWAGGLLVLATLASGLFSALQFAQLSIVVDRALSESQETLDLATNVAGSLEREDDALLLALSGKPDQAREMLLAERRRGASSLARLVEHLQTGDADEVEIAHVLPDEIGAYRVAGTGLLSTVGVPEALALYHQRVNPLLRQAVATSGRVREINFRTMERAGIQARDAARRATIVVISIVAAAFLLGSVVTVGLARSIVAPVHDLTRSVDAVRQGNYDHRTVPSPVDELGKLAEGFNRLAETVGEYRRSSLGELLAAKTSLEATVNALPEAVIVISPDGRVAAVNAPARSLLAAAGAEGAARAGDLPLRPEHRSAVAAALAGQTGIPARTDFGGALGVTVDGRTRRFLVAAFPIPEYAPRQFGAVIVFDDVTEFARLDELRTELIGVASHELKTPLTALRMSLMLLREEDQQLGSRQREMLSAALEACEELGSTIDELLDITRIEAGQLRLNLAPVDVCALARLVMARLQPRFDDAGVVLRLTAESDSAVVPADAARLASVLTNILVNALKYSQRGGKVAVTIGPAAPTSRQNAGIAAQFPLQIAVTDGGPGIPRDCRDRVFEKFFRVEHYQGADTNGVHGTGIGLYLCREIVRAHGGTIWCEPGEGGAGTRVAFTLPSNGLS